MKVDGRFTETPLTFLVDGSDVLAREGYGDESEALSRGELYYFENDIRSIGDLQSLLEECRPLCWSFNSLYWDFLDCVLEPADDGAEFENKRAWGEPGFYVRLHPGDDPWPPDFDGNASVLKRWSAAVGEDAFLAFARDEIDKWLEEEPDGDEYDYDRFDIPPTAGAYAFQYFSAEENLADEIGVELVEGWHPGDDTRAAILTIPIEEANERCRNLGVPIVFKKAPV